jgi:hypothetical protein
MSFNTFRRALQRTFDLPRHWRALSSQARLDLVFIHAMSDELERRRYFADAGNRLQHASGERLCLRGIQAQRRGFNITQAELQSRAGRKLARDLLLQCLDWAQQQGARLVLLEGPAARLFEIAELKRRYPELVLCRGDNGAAWLLGQQVEAALRQAFPQPLHGIQGLRPRTLVQAPYSRLGRALSLQLQAAGHPLVGWGEDRERLRDWSLQTGLPALECFEDLGEFDLLVACAAGSNAALGPERLQALRRRRRRLLLIDATGMYRPEALRDCQGTVCLQPMVAMQARGLRRGLLGSAPSLPAGQAEAFALFHAIYRLRSTLALRRDWAVVNGLNQVLLADALADLGLSAPLPQAPALSLGLRDPLRAAPRDAEQACITLPAPLQA